jgi:L-phenylalanine/L-methionine N-acetyltransferase
MSEPPQSFNYRLRPYEPEDMAAISEMLAQPLVIRGTMQMPWMSVEARRQRWATGAPRTHLVADLNARIIGSGSLSVGEDRRRHVGSIGMAVHDQFQGRGVGRALLTALIDMADGWLNLGRVELTVYADNAHAIALYESVGFEREGLFRRYAFRDGVYVDALSMARMRAAE